MKAFVLPLALLLVSAGCAPRSGQSVYSPYEVGVAKPVQRCRVLAVRDITIQGDRGRALGQFVGSVGGAVGGGALGREVGKGTGRTVATVLGGLAGGVIGGLVGDAIGADADRRPGLEYAVLDSGGREYTFAQEVLPGDRIVPAGATCRIQTDPYGNNRVLPADGLPPQVQRPQTTVFY